jgi:hypothetical protein
MDRGISACKTLSLRSIDDVRGNLVPIESGIDIPFDIRRVYTITAVPETAERGGHAHLELQQLIVAVSGSFEVVLDDGRQKARFRLHSPAEGLLVPRLIWREMKNFSHSAACLVLASNLYSETDYIRSYQQFLEIASREN